MSSASRGPSRARRLEAALTYAQRGIPVFPCKRGEKKPLTVNGFKDATTHRSRITAWWNHWPNANIGIPTGERSGILVLDVDIDKWGAGTLGALTEKHGELPPTLTVRTGSGGLHYYFRYPAGENIRSKAGELGPGLDHRAEGGYVVAPPSCTEGPYEVLDDLPLADPPGWLTEALRAPHIYRSEKADRAAGRIATAISADVDGPLIPEGTRDNTLFKIGCKLRSQGHDEAAILYTLQRVNATRCKPPLPEPQVRQKARQAAQYDRGNNSTGPTPATLETLHKIERDVLWGEDWSGKGGKSERDALAALIVVARRHGTRIPAGIRVSIDIRSWASATAVSKRAMFDAWKNGERKPGIISRLKRRGFIRSDSLDRSGTESGAFVLVLPRAEFHHSSTGRGEVTSGETLRAPRLRWSAPLIESIGDEVYRSTIHRLGKGCGAVIDALERAGGSARVGDLYDMLHPNKPPKKRRPWELRRRDIARLEAARVVECVGDEVSFVVDWLDALNRERVVAGEIEAARRDMARYEREREAYARRHDGEVGHAPTEREMRERRESYPERRRRAIEAGIASLFAAKSEYRERRVGQITCALLMGGHLSPDFPRGPDGSPTDAEVEAVLDGTWFAA